MLVLSAKNQHGHTAQSLEVCEVGAVEEREHLVDIVQAGLEEFPPLAVQGAVCRSCGPKRLGWMCSGQVALG